MAAGKPGALIMCWDFCRLMTVGKHKFLYVRAFSLFLGKCIHDNGCLYFLCIESKINSIIEENSFISRPLGCTVRRLNGY